MLCTHTHIVSNYAQQLYAYNKINIEVIEVQALGSILYVRQVGMYIHSISSKYSCSTTLLYTCTVQYWMY